MDDVFASKNYRFRVYRMTVQIHGEKDVNFEFHSMKTRDKCIEEIERRLDDYHERHQTVDGSPSSSRVASPTALTPPANLDVKQASTSLKDSGRSAPVITTNSTTSSSSDDVSTVPERQASVADPNIRIPARAIPCFGTIINLPAEATFKIPPRHFVLMTIGSRGDVQPYSKLMYLLALLEHLLTSTPAVALGKRLLQEGHRVTIASHEEVSGDFS